MSRALAVVLGWLVCLAGAAEPAHAISPRRFGLNLTRQQGAEGCVTSTRMAAMVEQLLGPVFTPPAEAELAVEVQLRAAEQGGWEARVTVSDLEGQVLGRRELRSQAQDCHALDRPLLLVIALAIDPELGGQQLPPHLLSEFDDGRDPGRDLLDQLQVAPPPHREISEPGHAAALAAAAPAPRPAPPRERAPALETDAAWQFRIGASAALARGMLPGWAAGLTLGVEAEPPHAWPLRLSLGFWPGSEALVPPSGATAPRVRFAMAQLSLSACPLTTSGGPWAVQACAGLLFAQRWTEHNDLDQASSVRRSAFGPMLSAGLTYAWVRALATTLEIVAHAPLTRDIFTYAETDGSAHTLFRPPAVALYANLGLALRI